MDLNGQIHTTTALLTKGKNLIFQLNSRMDGLQSGLGHVRENYTTITWNRRRCLGQHSHNHRVICIYIYIMYVTARKAQTECNEHC